MDSRYTELSRLSGLYLRGCPIIIEAGAILKDNYQSKVLLQLKFRNLSKDAVRSCKIIVRAFEIDGTELPGIESYSYLDINIPQGMEFGSREAVYLPDPITRKVEINIISVTFSEYSWNNPGEILVPIPTRDTLNNYLSEELYNTYRIETGIIDSKYIPSKQEGLFLCTCGAINLEDSETCYRCKKSVDLILNYLDVDYLSEKTNERKKKEEEERIQREKEEREKNLLRSLLFL